MQLWGRYARAVGVGSVVLVIALATGCGGGPTGNDHVTYDGQTLIVDGTSYPLEPSMDPPGTYLAGRVVLQPGRDQADAATALVQQFGLTLEGRSKEGWLLLQVPKGYEMQWASAFSQRLPSGSFATLDNARYPTAVAEPATSAADEAAAMAKIPADEPSADDVRRIAIDEYERLEDAGGLPVTVTASGQSMVLHAKVFSVRKQSCHTLPGAKPGEWECEAELMMGLCSGDCDPSDEEPLPKGERVRIRWDTDEGRFVSGN